MSEGVGGRRQAGLITPRRRALAVALPLVFGACSSGNGASDRAVPTSSSSSSTATSASTSAAPAVNGEAAPGPITGTASTPTTANSAPVPEITVRGTVAGVFASARVIQLVPPANGTASVALSADTEFVRAGGGRATLADVTTGATIEAVGHSSAPGTVVARKVTLL